MKQVFRRALKRLLKTSWAQPALRRAQTLYREVATEQAQRQAAQPVQADIPETTPLQIRPSGLPPVTRLNLLVPALSERHVFGGIATALRCFDALRGSFSSVRILVTDEADIRPAERSFYGAWPQKQMADPDDARPHIVACSQRLHATLNVHAGDVFMSTAWWTAHVAFSILDWQDQQFGNTPERRLLYLVQDYEPGFYAWSSRYALAEATYRHGDRTLAVFNTRILADYFDREGYHFAQSHVLEPRLNPALAAVRAQMPLFAKERIILVYGRPTVERNAFSLILAALRFWARQYPDAARWQVISVGESFEPIDLGGGCVLQALGKLSLEDYAQQLARSAIGLSLMISPHPSYPPLEMAAFGVQVLTNVYANKDLSNLSPQFTTLERVDPMTIAQALSECCQAVEGRIADTGGRCTVLRDGIVWQGDFLTPGSELGEVEVLLDKLLLPDARRPGTGRK